VAPGEGKEQSTSAGGIVMTTKCRLDGIPDMPPVHPETNRVADAQTYVSNCLGVPSPAHLKSVGRNVSLGWICRALFDEHKLQVSIHQ
jgi:hypothetical protein